MTKRTKTAIGAILAMVLIVMVMAEVKCPIDKSATIFTGKTMTDVSGKLLWEYKCLLYGHTIWVAK